MPRIITLDGDQGRSQFRYDGGEAAVIDATGARWTLANMGPAANAYPVIVEDGRTGLVIAGGLVSGRISLSLDWVDVYAGDGTPDDREGNSAAIELRSTTDAILRDWTLVRVWDGIRIKDGSERFRIEGVEVAQARDDAIESDHGVGGTIRDCLFDGVFSGISLGRDGRPDRSDRVVALEGVVMRMETYLYEGDITHQSPLKMEEQSPSLRISDSIFAVEDVEHGGRHRLELAWQKTLSASGNVFLNLSGTALPDDYPRPGPGWTVLEGAAAREFWNAARDGWHAARNGGGTRGGTGEDDLLVGAGRADTLRGMDGEDRLWGGAGGDRLTGGAGGDRLDGGGGADRLAGEGGRDRLSGGTGGDRLAGGGGADDLRGGAGADDFVFLRPSDGGDRLLDFDGRAGEHDRLLLAASGFGLEPDAGGTLDPGRFRVRNDHLAQDADDRLVYRRTDSTLWFDRNGDAAGGRSLLADLSDGTVLGAADILIV